MAEKRGKRTTLQTEHFLGIPSSLTDVQMEVNTHDLYIVVTADCNWCYADDNNCFPRKKFLKQGRKRKGRVHGPYTPVKKGTVLINAVPCSHGKKVPCDPTNPGPKSGHTITVGGP